MIVQLVPHTILQMQFKILNLSQQDIAFQKINELDYLKNLQKKTLTQELDLIKI
jgi:hypothetical protein